MMMNADIGGPLEGLSEAELMERVRPGTTPESSQRALQELSRRASPLRLEAFRAVLENAEHDSRTKRTAAVELGTERLPGNQALLMSQLDARDASLFAKVVGSLGKIGDEQALVRLEQIDPPEGAVALKALDFARSLLAYRFHLDRSLITPPSESELVEVTDGVPIGAEAAGPELVRQAWQEAGKDIPALAPVEEGAVRLTCQGNDLLLTFVEEIQQAGSPEALRTRSALPVVLLKKGTSLDRYFLDHYFFTQPAEGGEEIALLGVRPTGELTYAGRIRESADGFHFTLRSLASPYVPAIEVEGTYKTALRLLELTRAIASRRIASGESGTRTPRRA